MGTPTVIFISLFIGTQGLEGTLTHACNIQSTAVDGFEAPFYSQASLFAIKILASGTLKEAAFISSYYVLGIT